MNSDSIDATAHALPKVLLHEHLDGNVSIRYGPNVVGRFTANGGIRSERPVAKNTKPEGRGKGGTMDTVESHKPASHRVHRPLEIPLRDSHFPTATTTTVSVKPVRKPRSASRRGSTGQIE